MAIMTATQAAAYLPMLEGAGEDTLLDTLKDLRKVTPPHDGAKSRWKYGDIWLESGWSLC